jgi:hypothetical protein
LGKDQDFAGPASHELELIGRCIDLEFQAMRIYNLLAHRFAEAARVRAFLAELARQEEEHAELLEVCRDAVRRKPRQAARFSPWSDYLPLLEQQMEAVVASIDQIQCVEDAMRLVIQIEFSEVNRVFMGVVRVASPASLAKLRPFQQAVEKHIAYICRQIPEFAPGEAFACRELRSKLL